MRFRGNGKDRIQGRKRVVKHRTAGTSVWRESAGIGGFLMFTGGLPYVSSAGRLSPASHPSQNRTVP